jgi:hypothetical protein
MGCGFGHKVKLPVSGINNLRGLFGHNLKFSHRTSFLKLSLASAYSNGARVRLARYRASKRQLFVYTQPPGDEERSEQRDSHALTPPTKPTEGSESGGG